MLLSALSNPTSLEYITVFFVVVSTDPIATATCSCANLLHRVSTTDGILLSNMRTFYSNNMDCHWSISSTVMLQLVFLHFKTQPNDFLTVYDGGSSSSPVIGRFSGSSLPAPVTSFSGQLYLRFTSDSSGSHYGFLANYQGAFLLINIQLNPDFSNLQGKQMYSKNPVVRKIWG